MHNKLLRAKLATVGFIQLLIKIRFPKIPSPEMSSSSILVSAKMLTSMPDVMATTLAMAYCMVRSWFLMLMYLSTTPCTRAPNRKFTWPIRITLRPIFIRALGSCRLSQHSPDGRGRKEAGRSTAAEQREVTLRHPRRIDQKHRGQVKTTAEMSAVLIISCWAQAVPNKCVRGDQRFPRQKNLHLACYASPPPSFQPVNAHNKPTLASCNAQ